MEIYNESQEDYWLLLNLLWRGVCLNLVPIPQDDTTSAFLIALVLRFCYFIVLLFTLDNSLALFRRGEMTRT